MKCPNCGECELEYDELCDYQDKSIEAMFCPECGWEGGVRNDEIVNDQGVPNDDEIPVGCNTCGNAINYPNCKWSCPMFDD